MLVPLGFEVLGTDALPGPFDVDETADTFEGNALLKARALRERVQEGWVLADDSGLEIDALDGDPGVRSARYANVTGSDQDQATARFVCVLVLDTLQDAPLIFRGTCEGRIGQHERGHNGFGYDSIFHPDGDARTIAEYAPEEKNAISHRGRAVAALAQHLRVQRSH